MVLQVVVEVPELTDGVGNRGVVALDAENLVIELEGGRLAVEIAVDRCNQEVTVLSIDSHCHFDHSASSLAAALACRRRHQKTSNVASHVQLHTRKKPPTASKKRLSIGESGEPPSLM